MPFSYRDQALFQNSLVQLTAAMDKWQKDKTANEIMTELQRPARATPVSGVDPGTGGLPDYPAYTQGVDGITLRNAIEDHMMKRELQRAQIHHYMNPISSRAAIGADGLTPDQRLRHEEWQKNQTRLSSNPKVLAGERDDTLSALNHDSLKKFGYGTKDFPDPAQVAEGVLDPTTGAWTPQDNGTHWRFKAKTTGETVTLPKNEVAPFLRRFRALQPGFKGADVYKGATSIPAPVQPKINGTPFAEPDLPVPEKPLDPGTAKAILQEAGGDKNKARELARQRGYSF